MKNWVVGCMFVHTSGSIIAGPVTCIVPTFGCFVSHNIAGDIDASPTFSNIIPSPVVVEAKFIDGHGTSCRSAGSESEDDNEDDELDEDELDEDELDEGGGV